jgi:tyrosyl-tRNA synthetase
MPRGNPETTVIVDDALINELVTRGVSSEEITQEVEPGVSEPVLDEVGQPVTRSQIMPSEEALVAALKSGRQLTAYLGIDPTGGDLHVGHISQLRKLQRLQDLGHKVFLLIGDFTGQIGDPSDRSAARVQLTEDQVRANAATYKEQASKIINFEHPTNPARLAYNSKWLGALSFARAVVLASELTVAQLLARRSFSERLAAGKPIGLHEFFYPLMQGWDSVMITPGGIDIEVGGSDQLFNMAVGRQFVRRYNGKEKFVLPGTLLADPSGRKIGKTESNMVTINDVPLDMYHKVMLWGDNITPHALELCTTMPMPEIAQIRQQLASGELSGIEGKKILARRLVSELHSADAADLADRQYRQLVEKSEPLDPDIFDFEIVDAKPDTLIIDILKSSGLATSNNEARRLLQQGGIYINEKAVGQDWRAPAGGGRLLLRRGRPNLDNYRNLVIPTPRKRSGRRTAAKTAR